MYLDEAAVERQVVSDGVLPGSLVGAVVGKSLHDELVDARQSDALLGALLDGHGYQSYVTGTQTHTSIRSIRLLKLYPGVLFTFSYFTH